MKNEQLLAQIADYCRSAGMAESTFGRRAVNDGKLVQRLREGGRITLDTLERIRTFLGIDANAATPLLQLDPPHVSASGLFGAPGTDTGAIAGRLDATCAAA